MTIAVINPTKDSCIEGHATRQNVNNGSVTSFTVGNNSGATNPCRAPLHFDLSAAVPANAVIISSWLEVYVTATGASAAEPSKVYRLTQTGWVETQVTWINYSTGPDVPWTALGGDFTTTDGVDWNLFTSAGWQSILGLLTLVQDARVNRSNQLHVILKIHNEVQTDDQLNIQCRSREYADSSFWPKLNVEYLIPQDYSVRGVLPRSIVEPLPASVQWEGMRAAPQADFWVINRGVHQVRAKALEVEPFHPRSQLAIRKVNKLKFRASFVGLYHNFGTAEYRFYRSNLAPPLESDTPFATNASLPYTPVDLFADGIWYVSVAYYNGILTSGFLPLGPNGETYIRIEISGGVVLQTPPNPPISWELELRPAGVIRVKAFYQQTGSLRATQWAITYTTNGSTPGAPPAVSPTVSAAMPSSGAAVLEYDLPGQADGTTVKVRLQTRRNDGGTWRYSENSIVKSLVADAAGPMAPLVLQPWPGRLPEGV